MTGSALVWEQINADFYYVKEEKTRMNSNTAEYKIRLDGEIKDLLAKTKQVRESLKEVILAGKAPGVTNIFDSVEKSLEKLGKQATKTNLSPAMFDAISDKANETVQQLDKVKDIIEKTATLSQGEKIELLSPETQKNVTAALSALQKFSKETQVLTQVTEKQAAAEEKKKAAEERKTKATATKAAQEQLLKNAKEHLDITRKQKEAIEAQVNALKALKEARKANKTGKNQKEVANAEKDVLDKGIKVDTSSDAAISTEIDRLKNSLTESKAAFEGATKAWSKYNTEVNRADDEIKTATTEISQLNEEIEKEKAISATNAPKQLQKSYESLRESAQALGIDLKNIPMEYTEQAAEELKREVQDLVDRGFEELNNSRQDTKQALNEIGEGLKGVSQDAENTKNQVIASNNAMRELDGFKDRIKQFVGLQGAALLARRALQDAVQTIQELDEVMTEMSVVTDLGISDYWDQLPEHTKKANELGVAIKEVYKAETLYYQQGLKSNEVAAMSAETLKMARVASLSAEDATNKMTAALRGFNMELNETSAQRISDVYSELAAITASDVDEISSAMTKTASIASSAGMEFETTAAFLSQIIETTRESAETAGTALKTVIARFQELKKDPAEIGEVDGEVVDANKIETALRSVGVALRDSSGQFRALDEVFLELASKWDGLDTNTQRYIATIAAGSRQQSRFIAMMSDYGRTQELVTAANTSAGASNVQFGKTLESLESKTNRLKNAWNSFTMGLLDEGLLKLGEEHLTGIITLLDKASGAFGGLTNTLGKVGLALTVFNAGKIILNKFVLTIQEKFHDAAYKAGEAFERGLAKAKAEADGNRSPAEDPTSSTQEDAGKKELRGPFKKTRKKVLEGHALRKEARADLNEAFALKREAKDLESGSAEKKLKKSGNKLIDSGYSAVEKDFKAKMSELGAGKKANKDWRKYGKSLKQGGKEAAKGVNALNKALKDKSKNQNNPLQLDEKAVNDLKTGYENLAKAEEASAGKSEKIAELRAQAEKKAQDAYTKSQKGLSQISSAMSTMGQTAIGVGIGITALGEIFEKAGFEGAAEGFAEIGTVVTLLGTVLMGLPPIINLLGVTFSKVGVQIGAAGHTAMSGWLPVILVLAAVALAIGGLVWLFSGKEKSPQEKLKEAKEAAQAAADAADEAKQAYEDLLSSFDKYKDVKQTLNELEEGTLEWKKAVLDLNSEVTKLLSLYPQLGQYVKVENGLLSISDEGMEKMTELALERASTAAVAANIATVQAQQQAIETAEESETAKKIKNNRAKGDTVGEFTINNLKRLDEKLKLGSFDFSFQEIDVADYDTLTEEQLHQLYDSYYWDILGYSESQGRTKEQNLEWLKEEQPSGVTLYSKDIYEYAFGRLLSMEEIAEAGEELPTLLKSINESEMAKEQAAKAAISSSLDADVLNDGYGQMIVDSVFRSGVDFDERVKQKEEDNERVLWANDNSKTKTELSKRLAAKNVTPTGDEVTDLTAYYKALTGADYDSSNDGNKADDNLAEKIAQAEVAAELAKETKAIAVAANDNIYLSQLMKGDLDVDLEKVEEAISTLPEPAADADDYSIGIKKTFENAKKIIETEQTTIKEKMDDIFQKDLFGDSDSKKISYKVADQFIETYDMIVSYAGSSTAKLFADAVKPTLENTSLSAEEIQLKMDEFLNVKWDSAIEGAATLNKWLESDNEQLKTFAAQMLHVENKLYSATSQMNEFYKSMDSETLEKLAEDGKISATEILELAKSNEQLATMMDTTKISAATLGKYYDLIKKKTLKAIEATDSFVVALDKLNSASNAIENSFAFIDTFEPSRSQTEISSYFSEMRETVMGLYNQGAYGDEQLTDYIKAFLGEDNWSTILEESNNNLKTAIDQAISQINIYGDNLYQVWKSFAENEDFEGVTLGEDGIIEFDLNTIGTTDNLKKKIMDMGWSETMAEALVADAQTFSSNLEKGLKSVDIESALETWLAGAFKMDDKTLIPKSQVVAMAKELGLEIQQVTTILKANGIETIDFFTSDGDLSAKLREKFRDTMKGMGDGDKAIDFEAGYEMLLELGLDDAAAKKELKILAGQLEDVKFSIDDKSYKKTEGKFTQSGEVIQKNTIDAQIDAMEDPKVKRARERQTKEQAKMLSKALIIAQTIATQSMMKITTKAVDAMINSMATNLGLDITSSIAQDFEDNFELDSTITEALKGAEDAFALEGEAAGQAFENNLLEYVETTEKEVEGIAKELAKEVEDSKSGTVTAYTTDDSQTVKTDSDKETWENPYDEIYNLNKKINAVIREREHLERNYERALNDSSKTAQELADITAGELKALKEEAILQKNTAEVARQYISYRQKDNARFSKYYTYDSETNVIQVDWEAVGKSGWDSDTSDEFKEFISYLEEQVDIIQDAEDSLEDIQDSVDDIENRGRDATSEIYDQVKEGLIKERQNQIDELQNINDSIQEAQSALVEQMQKQIDEARQARENDKTEEDIADKRTRLAYLQQDTSGAKALEIMALEKEIREAEEGYTDSLVDQALQKLQDANEKAAEQRQRQIDLAQLALNEYEESGKVWADVKNLVDVGFANVAKGIPFTETDAGRFATISGNIKALNPITKKDFYDELNRNAKEGAIHQGFVSVTGEGKEGKTIADLSNDVTTAIKTNMDFGKIEPPIVNVTVNTGDYDPDDPDDPEDPERNTSDAEYKILDRETYERDTSMSARLRRDYYGTYENYLQKVHDLISKGKTPEFKTGGLADFTGPAWLDGTKSRPELVLNQTDTANFIALKDILAEIFDNSNNLSKGNSKSGGDNYYDIEISVEKIGDDYDVDRLADRIKEIIYEDSVYRNVNAVNFMR